jgi:hypothetical protein
VQASHNVPRPERATGLGSFLPAGNSLEIVPAAVSARKAPNVARAGLPILEDAFAASLRKAATGSTAATG